MKLTILGNVPSKKNSRQLFVRNGRMMNIPSSAYKAWEIDALWQLKGKPSVTTYPVALTMVFTMQTKRAKDLDNVAASILDMLQKAKIITNDDWQHICPITLDCDGVGEAKVEIFIDE